MIRHAVRLAGDRGVSRVELCDLFGDHLAESLVDEALSALVKAGRCTPVTVAIDGHSITRYRYWGPR